MAGSFPITPPASGTYPITIGFTTGQLASDANNTNDVANYAWKGVDSGPASARVATTGSETYTIASGSVTVINGLTWDGVTMAVGDVGLVKDAPGSSGVGSPLSSQPGNGLYYVTGLVGGNMQVARCATMSTASSQPNPAGRVVDVRKGGTVNGSTRWQVVSPFGVAAFTYGTTAMQWSSGFNAGSLDGVTIGATTPAPSIKASTLSGASTTLSGSAKPWLNQNGFFSGSLTGGGQFNYLAFNDQVVGDTNYIWGFTVLDHVHTPAIGLRGGIQGHVWVESAGTNTLAEAQYVGVFGWTNTGTNLGGTSGTPIGSLWGGWFIGSADAGSTYLDQVYGAEINAYVDSATSAFARVGLLVTSMVGAGGSMGSQGATFDSALVIGCQAGAKVWKNGLIFGRDATSHGGQWPFDSTSTMIGTGTTGAANIGIDFTNVVFTDAAIKTGAAPIALSAMASAPTAASGEGRLYVASDGSLHYAGHTTDTQIAPA